MHQRGPCGAGLYWLALQLSVCSSHSSLKLSGCAASVPQLGLRHLAEAGSPRVQDLTSFGISCGITFEFLPPYQGSDI
jgi:hypothetical protein